MLHILVDISSSGHFDRILVGILSTVIHAPGKIYIGEPDEELF